MGVWVVEWGGRLAWWLVGCWGRGPHGVLLVSRARFMGGCWKSWRARVVVGHGVFLTVVLGHGSCAAVSAHSKFDVGPCPGTPPFRPTRSGCQRRLLLNSGLVLPRVGVWVGYVVSGRYRNLDGPALLNTFDPPLRVIDCLVPHHGEHEPVCSVPNGDQCDQWRFAR